MGSKFSGGGAGAGTILTDLEVDGTTIVVNATTDKVGIGKAPTKGQLDVAGAVSAGSTGSEIHQLTGSLHLSSSSNTTLHLTSQLDCSLRLESDTLNNDEAQNPFIELIQDGGATDYTIGLTKGSRNPEGATILHMTDNALAMGSNLPITSTNVGHIQFYNRATASFSLMDRGSTNHGPADLQGFRVGIGPIFTESNFPQGRLEIHNTSTSPVPALMLTVSSSAYPAFVVESANTTRAILEVTGSSLDNGPILSAKVGANGSAIALKVKHVTGTRTTATTTDIANALPAFATVIAFGIRVTTGYDAHITKIGVTGDDDFFVGADPTGGSVSNVLKDGVLEQAGDTAVIPITLANNNFISGFADQTIRLTHGSSAQGAVRMAVYYYEITPPTS